VYGDIGSAVAALALLAGHAARDRPTPAVLDQTRLEPPAAGYAGARAFLVQSGVPMTSALPARTREEALAAAAKLGYPVVLKAGDVLHKSDVSGVVLRVPDEKALAKAFADLARRTGSDDFSVEEMAPLDAGVELIVGTKRDPRFGPVVLVGLGGVYAEILDDVAVALAPVGEMEAERLLRSLRGAPLFDGARGRRRLDVPAAARAVSAVSRAAAACQVVAELEVNPLLLLPEGVVGLDARVLFSS
jgi:acyl-CoA synthetase (NDP forming)